MASCTLHGTFHLRPPIHLPVRDAIADAYFAAFMARLEGLLIAKIEGVRIDYIHYSADEPGRPAVLAQLSFVLPSGSYLETVWEKLVESSDVGEFVTEIPESELNLERWIAQHLEKVFREAGYLIDIQPSEECALGSASFPLVNA